MKTACILLLVAFTAVATANRDLLAAPAPAPGPGPSSCPAPQQPSSTCVVTATTFQGQCASFISALQSATGGQVTATSSSQISALVQKINQKPSSGCCQSAYTLFRNACACDTSVQAVAKQVQNLTPQQFQTVGAVFLNACGYPSCTDTCVLSS